MPRAPSVASYTRRLSREDADTGSVLIEKSRWRMFPAPQEEFAVLVGDQEFHTCIVAEECDCVPPPHQHYHLEAGHFRHLLDFRPGASLTIERLPDADARSGRYRVT